MSATTLVAPEEAKLTKSEVKELKQEIKALYASYMTARIDLALKLYQLQQALALPGRGTAASPLKLSNVLRMPSPTRRLKVRNFPCGGTASPD